ncbi:hypothetical protein V5799_012268 [Amblyomma americanum]|uniref:Uncharacterized protein n=1 Tax=Amblyomma americanum TaxID=6943 RepID=A0AAQ4EEU8_AMBAM
MREPLPRFIEQAEERVPGNERVPGDETVPGEKRSLPQRKEAVKNQNAASSSLLSEIIEDTSKRLQSRQHKGCSGPKR